jgi:CBS domain-containing protein
MRISDVLHRKGRIVHWVRTTDTVAQAIERLTDHNIGALLVYDRWGRYAGIFGERDLIHGLERFGGSAPDLAVAEIMSQDIVTCRPDDRVHQAMSVMTVHRTRHLPVEEGGRIVGLVSIGDLVRALLQERELEVEVLRDMARAH